MHTLLLYLSILLMSLLCKLQIIFIRLTQFYRIKVRNFYYSKLKKLSDEIAEKPINIKWSDELYVRKKYQAV